MYKLYVDGGGQTIKDKVFPTYFSYKAFEGNKPIDSICMNRFYLRSLIPIKYYAPKKVLLKDGSFIYLIPHNGMMIPKNCSIVNFENKETNNIAEYAALYYGLQKFLNVKGVEPVTVYQDSQLIINQVLGTYQANKHLIPWCVAVQNLVWKQVTLIHVKKPAIFKVLAH